MNEEATILRFRELRELEAISTSLLDLGKNIPVWLFEGPMGAGKTTLIKSLCHKLGVKDTVTSPTFSLVNEYEGSNRQLIYHFDFYRINHETEALDMGVEEYFDSGSFCFIEWPSKIESLWPEKYLRINLDLTEDHERVLTVREMHV